MKLDDKGRCCGRKPVFYKGGSWCSPVGAPMYFCTRCSREYGPDGEHEQRENFTWYGPDKNGELSSEGGCVLPRMFATSTPRHAHEARPRLRALPLPRGRRVLRVSGVRGVQRGVWGFVRELTPPVPNP